MESQLNSNRHGNNRLNTWNTRDAYSNAHRKFKNLVQFHRISRNWLSEIDHDQENISFQIRRVLTPGVQEMLDLLQTVSRRNIPPNLNEIVDDIYPEELVERLSRTVWTVQAWLLQSILENTKKDEHGALIQKLEQASWKSGRQAAKEDWQESRGNFEEAGDLLLGFKCAALIDLHGSRSILTKRITREQVEIEILSCPHHVEYPEVQPVKEILCKFHAQWTRGYIYHLNNRFLVRYQPCHENKDERFCKQTWVLT